MGGGGEGGIEETIFIKFTCIIVLILLAFILYLSQDIMKVKELIHYNTSDAD